MLKETEMEETIVFFVTFFINGSISIGGAGPLLSLATPMVAVVCDLNWSIAISFSGAVLLSESWFVFLILNRKFLI